MEGSRATFMRSRCIGGRQVQPPGSVPSVRNHELNSSVRLKEIKVLPRDARIDEGGQPSRSVSVSQCPSAR